MSSSNRENVSRKEMRRLFLKAAEKMREEIKIEKQKEAK